MDEEEGYRDEGASKGLLTKKTGNAGKKIKLVGSDEHSLITSTIPWKDRPTPRRIPSKGGGATRGSVKKVRNKKTR